MYKPPAIPPVQNIQDKPTKDVLAALTEGWQVRNGKSDNRFVTGGEFDLALKNLSIPATGNQQAESNAKSGTAASAASIMVKVTYPFVANPVSLNQSYSLQYLYDNMVYSFSDLGASINNIRNMVGSSPLNTAIDDLDARLTALERTVAGMNKP